MSKIVLIVEDEVNLNETIASTVRLNGYTTLCAFNAKDAEITLRNNKVDLIILDVGLPDTDGFVWCEKIRKWSYIPIIFLTGRTEDADQVRGIEVEAIII